MIETRVTLQCTSLQKQIPIAPNRQHYQLRPRTHLCRECVDIKKRQGACTSTRGDKLELYSATAGGPCRSRCSPAKCTLHNASNEQPYEEDSACHATDTDQGTAVSPAHRFPSVQANYPALLHSALPQPQYDSECHPTSLSS